MSLGEGGQEGFHEDEWRPVDALDDSFRFKEEQWHIWIHSPNVP
jgi:hypothetical protein